MEYVEALERLLLRADAVARQRGDEGLCDCISRSGEPYQSERMAALLDAIRARNAALARPTPSTEGE